MEHYGHQDWLSSRGWDTGPGLAATGYQCLIYNSRLFMESTEVLLLILLKAKITGQVCSCDW